MGGPKTQKNKTMELLKGEMDQPYALEEQASALGGKKATQT